MREASKSHQIRIKVGFLPRKPTLIPVGSNYGRDDTARRGLKRWGAVEVWRGCCGSGLCVLGWRCCGFVRILWLRAALLESLRTRLDARCVQVDAVTIAGRAFGTAGLCCASVNPTIFSRSLEKRVPLRCVLRMLVFGGIRCKFGLSKMVNGRIA